MIVFEVNSMEEEKNPQTTPDNEGYVPRPAWQVWGARIGLVAFIGFVIFQIITIARGGL